MAAQSWPEWLEPFPLDRFLKAQAGGVYETALEEIRSGRKQSHWMWYIFPQIEGLGRSATSQYYAIRDRAEAQRYWQDPVLRERLLTVTRALLPLEDPIWQIMGYPDDRKLQSSMTLFYLVTGEKLFREVLDRFFNGELDECTMKKLKHKTGRG